MQRERAELLQFRAQVEQQREKDEQERLTALAAKGQAEEALSQYKAAYDKRLNDEKHARIEVEQRWLGEKLNSTVAAALAGKRFAGTDQDATARMLRTILESEVEAVRDHQGNPLVRDRKTHRPAHEYLKERLDSPEFALFFEANTRGGTGSDGAQFPANAPTSGDSHETFAAQFRARREAASRAVGIG